MALDPYLAWLEIAPAEQPPNHYRLLGIPLFEADATVIRDSAAAQTDRIRKAATWHESSVAERLFEEIRVARSCLEDPGARAAYDARLRQQRGGDGEKTVGDSPAGSAEVARERRMQGAWHDPGWRGVALAYGSLAIVMAILFYVAKGGRSKEMPVSTGPPAGAGAKAHPEMHPGAGAGTRSDLNWKIGAPQRWRPRMKPVALEQGPGFCLLTEIAGAFMGGGEGLRLVHGGDGHWELRGRSNQSTMFGSATPIHTPQALVVEEHTWVSSDTVPLKLIHENDGFPVLSGVGGGLRGGGEVVWLWLDADGIWWLGGRSGQTSLVVRAMTIRTGRKLPVVTYRVKGFGVPTRLIHRDRGICFLSGIAGLWGGSGEHAKLSIHDDGYWYFEFERGNDVAWAEATAVLFDDDVPDWRLLTTELNDFSQWTPVRGKWSGTDGVIDGRGDSELRFNHLLPQDLTFKFTLQVKKGMRPRILVNGTWWFYIGNEGRRHELFVHGSWLEDPEGAPHAYKDGESLKMEMRLFRDLAEFRVNGKLLAHGKRSWPATWELRLCAGDNWSPGECNFSNFEVGPVEKGDFATRTP